MAEIGRPGLRTRRLALNIHGAGYVQTVDLHRVLDEIHAGLCDMDARLIEQAQAIETLRAAGVKSIENDDLHRQRWGDQAQEIEGLQESIAEVKGAVAKAISDSTMEGSG